MKLSSPNRSSLKSTAGASLSALPILCVSGVLAGLAWAAEPSGEPSTHSSVAPAPAAAPAPQDDLNELEELILQLELSPDDPELLLKASEAAFAEAEDDRALWYAELARIAAKGTPADRDVEKRVRVVREEIGIEVPMLGDSIDGYSKTIFNLAKLCSSKKYYANAADMLGALVGSPYERDALKSLTKLFKKGEAIEAMLNAGVPIKVDVKKTRSDAKLKQLNEKHSDWEHAYEAKGKNYTIKTDMGVDQAETFLGAMEQMNTFYRQVFEHKARGGTMRRCEVRVFSTRESFDANTDNDVSENVAGFFMPGENSVTTFDPRSVEGSTRNLDDLWSTLYHEASHQFTQAVWKNLIPTWLNEGTASYFEGAALLTGGVVETNRIPTGRLRGLCYYLGRSGALRPGSEKIPSDGEYTEADRSPGLKAVVSYMAPGSYPGEYYPFGWGLVYFCLNYENENAERIYAPIYKEFMRSYTKTGGENPLKRFIIYFIEEPEIEGIESFDDFNNLWSDWIAELARREYGGPDQADKLIAQAQNEIAHEHPDYAVQSLRWALRKRADDPTALQLLAESYREVENLDAALFTYRTLATVARRAPEMGEALAGYDGTAEEALETALKGLVEVDNSLGGKVADGVTGFVADTIKEADAWVEAGYPRVALQAIAMGNEILGGDGTLFERAAAIQEEADGASITRTYRLPVNELTGWRVSGGDWSATEEGTDRIMENAADTKTQATFQRLPKTTFRFDVDIDMAGNEEIALPGISFAGGPASSKSFVRFGTRGSFGFLEFDPRTGQPSMNEDAFKRGPKTASGTFKMSIDVRQTETLFYVNDKEIGKLEQAAAAFQGQIGLTCWGPVKFVNPRLTY